MFRLYAGLVRTIGEDDPQEKWFNHCELNEIQGSAMALLDTPNKSGASRLLSLIKSSVSELFTEDGESYKLFDKDYLSIIVEDAWQIAIQIMKKIRRADKIIFPEYFYCDRCSNMGSERYTEVKECWEDLVLEGKIDEHYVESPQDIEWDTVLPVGIKIDQTASFHGGNYNTITRKAMNIGDIITMPQHLNEADLICTVWDKEICAIEGMDDRMFQIYVKRNKKDSFTKRYLIYQDDIDAMNDRSATLGLDPTERSVVCTHCGNEIGGTFDFTNFFDPLLAKK